MLSKTSQESRKEWLHFLLSFFGMSTLRLESGDLGPQGNMAATALCSLEMSENWLGLSILRLGLASLLYWATSGPSWLCVLFGYHPSGHINGAFSLSDLRGTHAFQGSDALAQLALCVSFYVEDSRFSTKIHCIEIKALIPKDLYSKIFITTSSGQKKKKMKTT